MKNLILHSRFWGIMLTLSLLGCQQLEDGVKNNSSRVDGDESIKSMVFVPEYSDGKAVMYYSTGTDGSFFPGEAALRFEISPAAMADKLAAEWETSLNVKLLYTKTKAAAGESIELPVTGAFASDGILTVTVSGEKIDDKAFFQKELSASVRLLATIGGTQKASEYISIHPAASDAILVPDAVFKKYLIDYFDVNHDGEFTLIDALTVTSIDISNKGVCSLAGTEHLSNLMSLNCEDNKITELDLSGCPSLEQLFCNDNNLTSLDLSACPLLLTLSCCGNQLRSLKLDGCSKLAEMYIDSNDDKLNAISGKSISIRGFNQADTFELNLKNTSLDSLSFIDSPRLTYLSIDSDLADLDIRGNGDLTSIDVLKCLKMKSLNVSGCRLSSLDVTKNTMLESLNVSGCRLSSLDVTKNTMLKSLDVSGCRLSSLDVTKNTMLKRLMAPFLAATELDLSANSQLCVLDLTGNVSLSRVVCPSQDWLDNLCVFDNHGISFEDRSGQYLRNSVGVKIDGICWAAYNVGANDNDLHGNECNFDNAQNACPNGWRLPTKDELESLSANYSSETVFNGIQGRWFSGSKKYSPTVAAIFLPYIDWSFPEGGTYALYWSSTMDGSDRFIGLYFRSDNPIMYMHSFSIRETTTVRCLKE